MHRILLVIKSDGIGGLERRVCGLLDAFGRRGIRWDLVALAPSAVSRGLLADHPVHVLASGLPSGPLRRLAQLVQLRALLRRHAYDLVLAFGPSPNALVCLARTGQAAAVISENGNPFVRRRRLWNATMMWTYRRADALLVQTERLVTDLRGTGRVPTAVVVCPPMLGHTVPLVAPSAPRKPAIVTVGRLVPSKRIDDLIEAFALVADRFPAWTLRIVGDGSARRALEDLAAARRVRARVTFTGFLSEPWHVVAESSIFALSSAHEGLPNVLIEAAASGCAIVSSDCRYGPREILDNGERGLLYTVGDVAQLAACLTRLMEDQAVRRGFAERAHDGITTRFRPDAEDPLVELLARLARGSRSS